MLLLQQYYCYYYNNTTAITTTIRVVLHQQYDRHCALGIGKALLAKIEYLTKHIKSKNQ